MVELWVSVILTWKSEAVNNKYLQVSKKKMPQKGTEAADIY